ncbi:MAG: polysaccharide biosynthesis C-terminal domain-containing protein [Phycisphaerales bacterium]|jgi:O-antigen/teichoic acid export membrane protein
MLEIIKEELRVGKTFLQFGFLKGLGLGLGMIAPLVVAKFFEPDLFGSYSLAKMVVFFFSTLLIGSSQRPFIVFANQERIQTGKINKSFSIQLVFLIFSVIMFLFLSFVFDKAIISYAKISSAELTFVLLAFIGLALKTFLCNLFMATGQRLKNSLGELIFGASTLFLVVIFQLTDTLNLKTVFLAYFISAIVAVVLLIWTINFNLLVPFGFDRKHFKDVFNFTKWVMFGVTAIYFINWGDNLVLRAFVSMDDIGEYNLGYQVFKGLSTLIFIVNAYFLPFISQHIGDSKRIREYMFGKRLKIFALGLVFLGLIFAAAPYVFRFFYRDTYQSSVVVLRVLLVGSVSILYTIFYDPILNALKKYRFSEITLVLQVLLNVLLDLVLVPRMGMLGAAVATTLAYFFRTIIMEVYFWVRLKNLLGI